MGEGTEAKGLNGNRHLLTVGDLAIDLLARRVTVHGRPLQLTPIEMTILYFLAANAGEVVSRASIIERVSFESAHSNAVDVYVKRLRTKIGDDAQHPRYIETVVGKGYRFLPGDTDR